MEYSFAVIGLLIGLIVGYLVAKKQLHDDTTELQKKLEDANLKYANVKNEVSEECRVLQLKHVDELKEIENSTREKIGAIQKEKSDEVLKIEATYREQRVILENNYNEALNSKNIEIESLFTKHKNELESAYQKGKEQGISEIRDLNQDLNITATPVVHKHINKGIIRDDFILKAGVQYQLFIRGMPSLEPSIKWEHIETTKEINPEKLQLVSEIAVNAIKQIAVPLANSALNQFIKVNHEPKLIQTDDSKK